MSENHTEGGEIPKKEMSSADRLHEANIFIFLSFNDLQKAIDHISKSGLDEETKVSRIALVEDAKITLEETMMRLKEDEKKEYSK